MQLNLHQTHHEIADFEGIFNYLTSYFTNTAQGGLHIFPELFLTGYPLQDLVLKKTFIDEYQAFFEDLSHWSQHQLKSSNQLVILVGGLHYEFDMLGLPTHIENVLYALVPGKMPERLYSKQLLANYDIYEEKKYFTPGSQNKIYEVEGKKIALLICEDMWFSHLHEVDPIIMLAQEKDKIDLVINFSASPFHIAKSQQRINRALEISQLLKAPFAYINRVGAEDEILFDGSSFVIDGSKVIYQAPSFKKEVGCILAIPEYCPPKEYEIKTYARNLNSWSTLYSTRLTSDTKSLIPLSQEEARSTLEAIILGITDYSTKNKLSKFTIALSGGMDSALVVAILKIIQMRIPIEIEAVFMPSLYSSSLSFDLSYDLCKNAGIKLTSMPIKFIHSAIKNTYTDCFKIPLEGLADENIQSRLRGALIYMRSNSVGTAVLNTSNKSELAVGYSTIYGDSVGALSVLGDLYKSEVFQLAEYINANFNNLIPKEIITRPPSAELRENQEDSQSLPPYERLDPILEALLSGRYSPSDLINKGHNKEEVLKVYSLVSKSEYKRRQFCPIIKLKAKSFGFGHRVPISKKFL